MVFLLRGKSSAQLASLLSCGYRWDGARISGKSEDPLADLGGASPSGCPTETFTAFGFHDLTTQSIQETDI